MLPPVVRRIVVKVLPMARRAVGGVGGVGVLAHGAVHQVLPFASGDAGSAGTFARGVPARTLPFASAVVGDAGVLADGVKDASAVVGHGVIGVKGLPGAKLTDLRRPPGPAGLRRLTRAGT